MGGVESWIGPAIQAGGTVLSAYGQRQNGADVAFAGQQQQALAQYQAGQMRVNAIDAQATAQMNAHNIQQQQDYVTSRALAVAAASGGGASDPTVINLIARTAGEGAYRKSVALYEGKAKAQALNNQADATEYGGSLAASNANKTQSADNLAATTTLVKGAASLYDKYAKGSQPGSDTSSTLTNAFTEGEWA
jgi:hypothetical protein